MKRRECHRHQWAVIGYGGSGWYLFRCACGATEIGGAA